LWFFFFFLSQWRKIHFRFSISSLSVDPMLVINHIARNWCAPRVHEPTCVYTQVHVQCPFYYYVETIFIIIIIYFINKLCYVCIRPRSAYVFRTAFIRRVRGHHCERRFDRPKTAKNPKKKNNRIDETIESVFLKLPASNADVGSFRSVRYVISKVRRRIGLRIGIGSSLVTLIVVGLER
jgi:hypothetical protein